ncbi:MAG TPA: DNA internalization-related competence protein ComEC/Rec2, partial [Steroidobacteraceae bacterium]|nr:DNA internalization-related competence protein ComEC/Rec2 [Steroidobacteraceae bacterium]
MVRNALAFVGGLLVVHQLPALPPAVPGVLVLGLFALLGLLLQSRIFLLVCCGFAWAWLNAAVRLAADLPPPLEGADLAITGCVATLPERATGSVRFGMDVDRTDERIPRFVELSWYEPQIELAPGDCLDATVRLRGRRGFANPGGFDYEAQLLARGVGATGYVRELERTEGPARPWRYSLAIARSWLSERLDRAVGERPAIGIIKGLAIGDRQALTDTQWRTLSATGTSHLMAISGLHIGIVAGLAAWFGRAFARWPGAQRRRLTGQDAAAASAMLAATVYAALAGFAIPTQRALAMLAVYLLARTLRRNGGASAILAWSAVVVVLIDPFAPLSAGAWLSFGAVAAILWGMAGRPVRSGRYTDFLRVQGAVTLCLVPFLVSGFGQVSLVSPIANLLAIPAFSLLIVPLVLLGTLLMAVSLTAGAAVLALAATAVEFAWPVLEALADWPLATLHVAMPTAPALLLLGCLTWLAIAPLPWPARFLAIVGSALLLARTPPAPPATEVEVAVLDVGQGLAVVVRTERHALVYDTGPAFRSGRDTGELVVLPYLRSQGIRRVDRLVATHGDLDHVGGLDSVIAGIEVLRVIAG